VEYLDVSYEAWQMKVDDITMVDINPEAASLYARDQRIERESSLLLPAAQRHVGLYHQQTSVPILKPVAEREAARQLGLARSQATRL
jgi:regulator of protease activity HflC (stomatin/prohibitin superfamily)